MFKVIKNEQDIKELFEITNFHDGFVEKIERENNNVYLVIKAWDVYIGFMLEDAETNLEEDIAFIIYSANMFIENNKICWVDNRNIKKMEDITSEEKYFIASKVSYIRLK